VSIARLPVATVNIVDRYGKGKGGGDRERGRRQRDIYGMRISALVLVKGSLVLMIHINKFRETVLAAGRVPGLVPCLISTFIVIDLFV
jgi:hypothetical protein